MPALARVDLVVSTEGQRPEQVAQRIRDAVPAWPPTTAVGDWPCLRGAAGGRILGRMLGWVVLVILGPVVVVATLAVSGALRLHRYSSVHVDGRLAVAGRGLFFSRTPDGAWWRLRLRTCRRVLENRDGWGEPPADCGVREPRRPLGPPPLEGQIALDERGR